MSYEHIVEKYRKNIVFIMPQEAANADADQSDMVFPCGAGFIVEGGFVVTSTTVTEAILSSGFSHVCAAIYAGKEGEIIHYEYHALQFVDSDEDRGVCILSFMQNVEVEGFSIDDLLVDEDGIEKGVEAIMLGFPMASGALPPKAIYSPIQIAAVDDSGDSPVFVFENEETFAPGSLVFEAEDDSLLGMVTALENGEKGKRYFANSTQSAYELLIDIVYQLKEEGDMVRDENDEEYLHGYDKDEFENDEF